MSGRIVIEPADLRRAARTYDDAAASLGDVRGRMLAVPPQMPGPLEARVAEVLERSVRDLTEQLDYLPRESAALRRRARFAELADGGRFNAFLDVFDPFGLSGVPALDERFAMPAAPPVPKKGFWEKGIPGFFAGVGGNLKNTAYSAGDLVSMVWDGDERREFGAGLKYAWDHPDAAWRALWADVSAEEDREAGRVTKAAGSITVEILGLAVAPLKLTKLKAVKRSADAAKTSRDAASGAASAACDSARVARERLANGPRWRTGEVPWQPTGPAPGRWADPQDFRQVVVDPADRAAAAARARADDAQQAFVSAQESYDRWNRGLQAAGGYGNIDTAAKIEKITDELDKQRRAAPSPGGGGGGR